MSPQAPRRSSRSRTGHARRALELSLVPLLFAAAAARPSTAQIVIRDNPLAGRDNVLSVLPGSTALEGLPFVVELRGERGAKVLLGLRGREVGAALGRSLVPVRLGEGLWGVPVQLDAEGRAQVTLQGWCAGSELTLCVIGTDLLGRPAAMSGSLSVRPLPATGAALASAAPSAAPTLMVTFGGRGGGGGGPRGPQVSPSTAAVGGQIVVSGPQLAALSGYAPEDVRISNAAVSGCLGRASAVGASSVSATITAGSPFPISGPLRVLAGDGAFHVVPPFGGMTFANPVWGWSAPPGAPAILTGTSFKNTAQSVFQPCGDPDMFLDLRFRVEGGMLKVTLPGAKAVKGDVFSSEFAFTFSDGGTAAGSFLNSEGLLSASGWPSDSMFILVPLSVALASICPVAYNTGSNEIWILPPSGKDITAVAGASFLHIAFDPNEHVIVTETHGVNDAYSTANGPEATTPSAVFDTWVLGYYPIPTRREYDMSGCDLFLRDTFSAYGPGTFGPVRTGNVQMHINGFGCQTYTDGIALGWSPTPAFDWSVGMTRLESLNFGWNPGDDATLCFDLARLPVVDASNQIVELRNILERVNENHLDLAVHDDTTVDCVTLKVLRCKTP